MEATTNAERDVDWIRSLLLQAYQDMAAGNIDHLMTIYSSDAVIQSPSQPPLIGHEAIRLFWRTIMDRFDLNLVPHLHEVVRVGDMLVVRGQVTGSFVPKNGEPAIAGSLLFWRGANGPNP